LWAWGSNIHGQLGDGTNIGKNFPVEIDFNYSAIAAGYLYSVALKTDETLWIWGWNIGFTPVQIGEDYLAVVAGHSHSLALKTDGTLWSWGSNPYGELGDGTNANKSLPIEIGENFSTIAASGHDGSYAFDPTRGNSHSFGVKTNGTLWAWGGNNSGQLGDGTYIDKNYPVQIGSEYIAVSTGPYHALALKSDGTLWSWGRNYSGQLGDGTNIDTNRPAPIGSH
jgi:alpha-tubulin suppressor-like RCC1 family protein